jgi:rhodanese-related sulfurtransferase
VKEVSVVELRDGRQNRMPSEGLVVCERGARSAEAARLLLERGGARYLGGGLQWREAAGVGASKEAGEDTAETAQGPVSRTRD